MIGIEARPRASHPAMRRARHCLGMALGFLIASAAPTLAKCPANADADQWVDGGELCLAIAASGGVLPFPTCSFDIVVAITVLCFPTDPARSKPLKAQSTIHHGLMTFGAAFVALAARKLL
jgi:hypothetical protein